MFGQVVFGQVFQQIAERADGNKDSSPAVLEAHWSFPRQLTQLRNRGFKFIWKSAIPQIASDARNSVSPVESRRDGITPKLGMTKCHDLVRKFDDFVSGGHSIMRRLLVQYVARLARHWLKVAQVIFKLQDNSLNSNHAFGLLYDHFVQLVTNMLLVCQLRFEIDQTLFRFFCRSWIMVWHGSVVLSEEISGHRLA